MTTTGDSNDILARRALLEVTPAPQPRHDAVVMLERPFLVKDGPLHETTARLRYVPDRDIITPNGFERYLMAISKTPSTSLEIAAQTMLEDINDQVIPCWLEVLLVKTHDQLSHKVRIEDRQPRWQDRGILDRIGD